MHDGFRIPDKVFAALTAVVIVVTWAMAVWFYPDLPARIVSHFGISGQPDAYVNKTWFSVFFPSILQVLMAAGFAWLYRHPELSNIPSSLTIVLMPEPYRAMTIRILKHFLVMTLLLTSLIFAYTTLAVISVSLGVTATLNGWIMGGLVAFLLFVVAVYTVWMYRLGKAAVAVAQAQKEAAS